MTDTGKIVVLITTSSPVEAENIANLLLENRKAACVNIIPGVRSAFWWQGKIDNAEESLLLIKTRADLFPDLMDIVKQAHSYTVPEIIALPIITGNPDYLSWIDTETKQ
jgi:periplasmic divalent cation tolerance protein